MHFFTPLGGFELAVHFMSESEHLHLCQAGGETIALNHFNKSRFLIISPFHMQCVGGRGSIQCRRPSVQTERRNSLKIRVFGDVKPRRLVNRYR